MSEGGQERSAHRGQSHHRGQRVSRQPQHEAPVRQFGEDGGVSRPHCHAVDDQPSAEISHGSPKVIGRLLFREFLLPFEVTSILILIAIMGAVVLASPEHRRFPQPEPEEERELVAAGDRRGA